MLETIKLSYVKLPRLMSCNLPVIALHTRCIGCFSNVCVKEPFKSLCGVFFKPDRECCDCAGVSHGARLSPVAPGLAGPWSRVVQKAVPKAQA